MSLQLAAQHMASRGRGPDTQLVHMAPQEVAGLQALAKAHGGSLTINPETGLAEAGFLKNLLPTLIGAGLSIASGGTLTPLMAAGITGAGYGVATGSLQKGLMAGLGAYGGAGLAGGLTAAAGTIGAEAGAAGAGAGAAMGPQTAAQLGSGFEASMAAQGAVPTLGATGASMGAQTAGQLGSGFQANMAAQGVSPVATATPMPTMTPIADRFAQAGKGFGALGTEAGRDAFMGNAASKGVAASGVGGGMGLMKSAYAAATPLMIQEPAKQGKKEEEKPIEYDFDFGRAADPNAGYTGAYTGERKYFDPRFTRKAADGGLMGLGTVQAMSDRNMAQTIAANGGRMFASGGSVRPVEEDPYYTMSGQSGDAFKYLMGQTPTPRAATPTMSTGTAGLPAAGDTAEYDYTFDPITNRYSRTPKAVTPPAPVNPATGGDSGGGSYDGGGGYNPGGGGYDDSFYSGTGLGSNNAPVENMGTDTGFGGMPAPAPVVSMGTDIGYGFPGDDSMDFGPAPTTTGPSGSDPAPASRGLSGFSGPSNADYGFPGDDSMDFGPAPTTTSPSDLGGGYSDNSGGYSDNSGGYGGVDSGGYDGPGSGGYYAKGGIAALSQGGPSHLGDYSDGGRLLRGPGDGVSDSIPATIANKRPARLADGEFVVPARIVSELGNGSTEAGARKLYAMMDRIQKARKKSIGKNRVAVNSKTEKMLPA